MKDLEKPSSADEALFEPEPTGKSSVPPPFTTEPKGKSFAAPEVPPFTTEPKGKSSAEPELLLFAPEPTGESPVDFELPADFFEPLVFPDEGETGDRLVREMWPEIPANDPSHDIPQAVVRRWSDEREPLSPALRIALVVGTLMVVLLGGVVAWRVMLSRPQPAPTTAAASPAASPPPVVAAPLTAPSPDLAAPITPPVTPAARAASPPVVPAPPVPVPATVPPPAPAPIEAIAPQPPPRVVMPPPESQRYTGPAVTLPPLVGIPMPASTDPRPAVVAPVNGAPVAPAAAATAPPAAPRPASTDPGPAPTAPVPSATRAPAATGLANGNVPVVGTDELRLRALMDRYRAAFGALDVDQARSVWPKVDARALSRAFGQLTSQSFDFSSCEVVVTGDRASAGCSGNAEYVTKVGSRAPRTDARVWQFEFRRLGDQQWRIESVVTR